MRREAMNNSSSLALQCSGPCILGGPIARCKMPPEEGGVSRVNAKGQTDERPPYSGQILWTLSGPFSWSSLATMLAAGGLQAGAATLLDHAKPPPVSPPPRAPCS